MSFKLIKKGSRATYNGKKVKIEEILLDKALICEVIGKKKVSGKCSVVNVNNLKNITPKPRG